MFKNSGFPGKLYNNNEIKRGKLKEINVFNQNSEKIYSESYLYDYKSFFYFDLSHVETAQLNSSSSMKFMSSSSFNKEENEAPHANFYILEKSQLNLERNLQESVIKKYYYPESKSISETIINEYDEELPFKTKQVKQYGEGETEELEYYYPFQKSDEEYIALSQLNMIDEPIEQKKIFNEAEVISKKNYSLINDSPFLESMSSSKKGHPEIVNISFDKYDEKGNVLQYTTKGGIITSIIWGYNKTLPIVKIENAAYDSLLDHVSDLQSLSNSDDDTCLDSENCNENDLRERLSAIRSLPVLSEAHVTTYTYNPLIGITSMTDPKGYTIYYEYDKFSRLKYIKDTEGNIVTKNDYNYANSNISD